MIVSTVSKPSENKVSFDEREKELEGLEKEEQQRQKNSPFSRFYQVNKECSKSLTLLAGEQPKALQILLFIFDHMDKYNALVCSYKVLEEALGLSHATVARSIKYLKEHGFIVVLKSGTANVYVASDKLVWNSWGKNQKYCKFPSNVMVTMSEQEELNKKIKESRLQSVELKK